MSRNEFYEQMRTLIEEKLPEGILAEGKLVLKEVRKNNDVMMQGIMISRKGSGDSPILYLDDAYDAYHKGRTAEELAAAAADVFCRAWDNMPDIDIPSLRYEDIKDRIFYRIVDVKKNRGMLSEMKYSMAGCGFAKIYRIAVDEEGSIPITNSIAAEYGYDTEKIFEDAERNTPKLYPAVFEDLQDVVRNFGMQESPKFTLLSEREGIDQSSDMFLLTSRDMTNGPATIFYPDVKEKIAEIMDDSYYVLPSSVKELIVVSCRSSISPEQLGKTVIEVNKSMESEAEVLSDRIMKYDRDTKELKVVRNEREKEQERGR